MSLPPTSQQIIKLYKNLLRYGQNLQYTDKQYFYERIKNEFKSNKTLTDETKIIFNYKKGRSLLDRQAVL